MNRKKTEKNEKKIEFVLNKLDDLDEIIHEIIAVIRLLKCEGRLIND